jgi:hypothetical protein
MAEQASQRPRVFLSSAFRDGGGQLLNPLRQAILEIRDSLPVALFAYELEPFTEPDGGRDDVILDRCFRAIRSCDLFVFLMTGRHGSGTGLVEGRTLASYLELELFAAVTFRKPILVLGLADRIPDPALHDSMTILSRVLDNQQFAFGTVDALIAHLRHYCALLAAWKSASAMSGLDDRLRAWLSLQRTHNDIATDIANPLLRFLDGAPYASRRRADPDKARALLDQAAIGVLDPRGEPSAMPHGAALMRLWAAARELSDENGSAWDDPLIAPLWDRMLGLWASRASWFGLHGHLLMSPLAALNSQTVLRRQHLHAPAFKQASDVREPLGGRASAHYSIANRMPSRALRIRFFEQARILANQAIALDSGSRDGILSIRGHIALRMARLGYYWRIWSGIADFRSSLDLRAAAGASLLSIGEAQTDLGFALVLGMQPWSGIRLLEEGVQHMRGATSPTELAFLARGLRKLETGYSLTGRRNRSLAIRRERADLAEKIQAFDQLPSD